VKVANVWLAKAIGLAVTGLLIFVLLESLPNPRTSSNATADHLVIALSGCLAILLVEILKEGILKKLRRRREVANQKLLHTGEGGTEP
jgi:hypothetical protein